MFKKPNSFFFWFWKRRGERETTWKLPFESLTTSVRWERKELLLKVR